MFFFYAFAVFVQILSDTKLFFYVNKIESVSWPEVERLFHQSVFEAMILTKVDQNGVLLNAPEPQPVQQQTLVIPWDNPVLFAKQKLQTVQTKGL